MKTSVKAQELTREVKEVARSSGSSLVGVTSAALLDSFPTMWVDWRQMETKKTTDILPDAKSVVAIGYHVWDDMLELAIRKGQKWVYPGYLPLEGLEKTVAGHLEKRGYKAVPAYELSLKRTAQLAGFGNYGKNALIVNPVFGPWMRLATVLTNAEMITDKPFEKDLCGKCDRCIKACPAGALAPYKVDFQKCLVGMHLKDEERFKRTDEWKRYEPSLTANSHLMCLECQKACRYGKAKR